MIQVPPQKKRGFNSTNRGGGKEISHLDAEVEAARVEILVPQANGRVALRINNTNSVSPRPGD